MFIFKACNVQSRFLNPADLCSDCAGLVKHGEPLMAQEAELPGYRPERAGLKPRRVTDMLLEKILGMT